VIDSWNTYVADRDGDPSEIVEFDDKLAAIQALRDGAVEGYSEAHHFKSRVVVNPPATVEAQLAQAELTPLFDQIMSVDSVHRPRRPDPQLVGFSMDWG